MIAIVLAGGRGTRLAPWPAPKALMPVGGVTILERLLSHVESFPVVERAVVCTGYRATDVDAAIKKRSGRMPVYTSYMGVDETMVARILCAGRQHRGHRERALILYGDELADVDVDALIRRHEGEGADATFTGYMEKLPFGIVRGGRIVEEHVLVNIGFAVIEPAAWSSARAEDGLADWLNRVEKLAMYRHLGRRATVNSLLELERAEEVWR